MRKILALSVLFSILTFVNLQAQGIKFEEGNWASVKEKTKKENKLIFVDAYTSWCGPCKWMAKNVFTNDTVGKFYNEKFINYTMDMEKGEGIAFAKEYKISVYPSLLFLDSLGKVMHKAIGSRSVKDFVALGEKALNPELRLAAWQKKYNTGNREPEFIRNYLTVLEEAGMETNEIATWYFAMQKDDDLLTKENWEMLNNFLKNSDSKTFNYLLKNKEKFYSLAGKEKVDNKILDVYQSAYRSAFNRRGVDEEQFSKAIAQIKNSGLPESDKLLLDANMNYYKIKGDWQQYTENTILYCNKYLMNNSTPQTASELNNIAWAFYEDPKITNKEALKNAVAWAKKSTELQDAYFNNDTYSALLYKAGNKKEAIKAAEKAIELAKKEGENASGTKELLEKMKSMK